jgi:REP element-mobilizing transposase RayT
VIGRGIERASIFRDDTDRDDFLGRLGGLAISGAFTVYAWALLPNHFHLLVRSGNRHLARAMRSLLTGYAGAFNRRHKRHGHLFQNRYRSIVVEADPYFLELIRYLHLNPLRAGVVVSLRALDSYPYAGHAALLGTHPRPWQATGEVLGHFSRNLARARTAYRAFVTAGAGQGHRADLQGGGLVRSLGGWEAAKDQRRSGEVSASDPRILGGSAFVEATLRGAKQRRSLARPRPVPLETLLGRIARTLGVSADAMRGPSRVVAATQARQILAHVWVEHLGQPASTLARALGQTRGNVSVAAKRGAAAVEAWQKHVARWCR